MFHRPWIAGLVAMLGSLSACVRPSAPLAPSISPLPFHNLGLEHYTPEGYPSRWYVEAETGVGGKRGEVAIRPDTTEARQGARALHVATTSEGPVVLYTPLLPGTQCLTDVAVTAAVRARDGVRVAPFLLLPGSGRPDVGQPAPSTDRWETVSHRWTRSDCLRSDAVFGVLVTGRGSVWLDDLTLTTNGAAHVDPKPSASSVSAADLRAMQRIALRVDGLDPAAHGGDLRSLRPLRTDSGVVALGENTHGASSVFRLKHRLIRHLVEREGFTTFALEMPATEGDVVNDYVSGRSVDRQRVLDALRYPSWQTKEMWDIVEWVRSHNRTAKTPVAFRGFDVQQPPLALEAIRRAVALRGDGASRDLAARIGEAMASGASGVPLAASLCDSLARHAAHERPDLARYARTLGRGLRMNRPDLGGGSRDASMAEEVLDLARMSRRLILWADNTHVSRFGGAMGRYLADSLGGAYVAIGFSFDEGEYSAYGPHNPYRVHQSYAGTHEHTLRMLEQPTFLLELARLPKRHPLHEVAAFRYMGSRPQEFTQFFPVRLADHFDFIGFTRRTEATTHLREHRF